jgi:hypothetical protein
MFDASRSAKTKRVLSPWELDQLLEPVHAHRATATSKPKERKHTAAVLSYVYRNRYVVASQVQRRFPDLLPSDRTTRRRLAELEDLGYLTTVPTRGVSPLWPKVYGLTQRGAKRLREALTTKGVTGDVIRVDRARREGFSAEHLLHEIWLTEFLLNVWQTDQRRDDLRLLQIERRSLPLQPAFNVTVGRRQTRLEPDALFVYRQEGRGLMCCLLELDMGTMTPRQLRAKFLRYEAWSESPAGNDFLLHTYLSYGAKNPRPMFRLVMVLRDGRDSQKRLQRLLDTASKFSNIARRGWFTTVDHLRSSQSSDQSLGLDKWTRLTDEGPKEGLHFW